MAIKFIITIMNAPSVVGNEDDFILSNFSRNQMRVTVGSPK